MRILCSLFLLLIVMGCEPQKPNILLILVDDLGKEWVSSYGSTSVQTPNIDKLASEGVKFLNAYSMPQCTPSRLTLLTGQYPFRHGWINHWDVPRWGGGIHYDYNKNPSMATFIQKAGYKTAVAGKWQVNDFRVQPEALKRHGFDEYLMWTGYEGGNPPSGNRYWDPYLFGKDGSKTYEGKYGPDLFTDFLIDFMVNEKDKPWFVYFPMALTHPPLDPTPDSDYVGDSLNRRHKAMVLYTDKIIGKIYSALSNEGLLDNTVIIFTTDNGTSRGLYGDIKGKRIEGAKARTTEPGICNPFIIRYPKMGKGKTSEALVDFTDLFPTLADLTSGDLPTNYTLDGVSFAGMIQGKDKELAGPRSWILSMGGENRAKLTENGVENEWVYRDRVLRNKKYKLYIGTDAKPEKFIDLAEDPWEESNLLETNLSEEEQTNLDGFMKVASGFPAIDSEPIYDPLPYKDWYVPVAAESGVWKKK